MILDPLTFFLTFLSDLMGASAAALVGGTASVIGGGKFANGAQTAAIQYLFNQIGEDMKQVDPHRDTLTEDQRDALIRSIGKEIDQVELALAEIDQSRSIDFARYSFEGFPNTSIEEASMYLDEFRSELHLAALDLANNSMAHGLINAPDKALGLVVKAKFKPVSVAKGFVKEISKGLTGGWNKNASAVCSYHKGGCSFYVN